MQKASIALFPRAVFVVFVAACTLFALAALWTVISVALLHLPYCVSELFHDKQLLNAFLTTGELYGASVILQIAICVACTLFITSLPRTISAVLLVPYATGVVAPAFAFYVFLSTGIGPLNTSLINSPWSQRSVVVLVDTWQWAGILIAAAFFQVNRIPRSYFELADLEGIGRWKRWWYIVLPRIRFLLVFYTVFRALDWMRKTDIINALFGRGYGGNLQTVAMRVDEVLYQASPGSTGFGVSVEDPYGRFLAVLEVGVLIILAIWMSRRPVVNDLYVGSQAFEGGISAPQKQPRYHRRWRHYLGVILCSSAVFIFLVLPLLWIVSASLQDVDLPGSASRFHLLPHPLTTQAYESIIAGNRTLFNGNAHGIKLGLLYSLKVCGISAAISWLLAVCGTFLFVSDSQAERLRAPLLAFVFSIFFFPPVIVPPALDVLNSWFGGNLTAFSQLLFVYSSTAFVLSMILLLVRTMTVPRAHFEQILLEKRSRFRAFYEAYLRTEMGTLLFIFVLAFSSSWSEFYVSTFATVTDEVKPFSVILEMNHTQYNAYYSLFAAGAGISLLACIGIPTLTIGLLWCLSRANAMWRNSRLASGPVSSGKVSGATPAPQESHDHARGVGGP